MGDIDNNNNGGNNIKRRKETREDRNGYDYGANYSQSAYNRRGEGAEGERDRERLRETQREKGTREERA